jgi:hypothetical protein
MNNLKNKLEYKKMTGITISTKSYVNPVVVIHKHQTMRVKNLKVYIQVLIKKPVYSFE